MITDPAGRLGPFMFVPVGDAYVRIDRIAVVGPWEVILLDGSAVALGDEQTALGVLADIARAGRGRTLTDTEVLQ